MPSLSANSSYIERHGKMRLRAALTSTMAQ